MTNFFLIGLTGNLGSGKSTVRRMLEDLGAYGIDADRLAHAAMMRGTYAWSAIVETFGPGVLQASGKIDRQLLGARVFGNPEELEQLEKIVHPAVGELVRERLRTVDADVVVLEAVKLIDANLHLWCDSVWLVTASEDAQINRVMRDRSMRAEDARARLASQSMAEEKRRLANVIIDNSFDLEETRRRVQAAWRESVRLDQARDKSDWLSGNSYSRQVSASSLSQPFAAPLSKTDATAEKTSSAIRKAEGATTTPTPSAVVKVEKPQTDILVPKLRGQDALESVKATPSPAPIRVVTPPPTEPFPGQKQERPAPSSPPETPAAKGESPLSVRRARRNDLDALGVALAKLEKRANPLSRTELLKRSGERGYRIAVSGGAIIALAAWEAENLVAVTREVWAESGQAAAHALPRLLGLIEQDARELQCEASIVLVNALTPDFILDLIRSANYQLRPLGTLNRIWRQVAEERAETGDLIWIKRLREDLVTKPI